LKNCIKIKKLTLNLESTQNIDALKYLTKLEELEIKAEGNDKLSYAGLSYCKNLKILDLVSDVSSEVLKHLKNCSKLEKFDLQSKAVFNVKLNISNFYGIKKLHNLKKLSLCGGIKLLESNSKLFID
ncbi:uncharacterized protein METZ01_LOCUS122821, partial [marine metagenome]